MHTTKTSPAARWALVAGGSGGLGSAIVRALASDGWNVALTYRGNEARARRVAAEAEASGVEAIAIQLDLTDRNAAADAISRVAARGPLAGLVYAAGPRIRLRYVTALSPADFADAIDGDFKACVNLLHPGLPHLREHGGAIVALSTQALARYAKRDALSTTPKAAVEAFVRAVAAEEGRYGTRANVIEVGVIEGDGMWEPFIESGDYSPAMLEAALQATAMRRFGTPEDVAGTARFLMSHEAGWVTGQTIGVDGGYSV